VIQTAVERFSVRRIVVGSGACCARPTLVTRQSAECWSWAFRSKDIGRRTWIGSGCYFLSPPLRTDALLGL
jgi:hypothetical protein